DRGRLTGPGSSLVSAKRVSRYDVNGRRDDGHLFPCDRNGGVVALAIDATHGEHARKPRRISHLCGVRRVADTGHHDDIGLDRCLDTGLDRRIWACACRDADHLGAVLDSPLDTETKIAWRATECSAWKCARREKCRSWRNAQYPSVRSMASSGDQ